MSEPRDPLEAELAALRPHELSPAVRRRVAERLAAPPPRRFRALALAAGLVAASLAVAVVWPRGGQRPVEPGPTVVEVQPAAIDAPGDAAPTVQAYQHALARSPAELDALLDKHARLGSGFHAKPVGVNAFGRAGGQLQTWLGEQ